MQKNQNIHMVPLILALVVIGFVPVLIGNYVPQDQWRIARSWVEQIIVVDGGSKDGKIEWAQEKGYEV